MLPELRASPRPQVSIHRVDMCAFHNPFALQRCGFTVDSTLACDVRCCNPHKGSDGKLLYRCLTIASSRSAVAAIRICARTRILQALRLSGPPSDCLPCVLMRFVLRLKTVFMYTSTLRRLAQGRRDRAMRPGSW